MVYFQIHSDSDISPSQQLFDQIQFAIASRQYPPGHKLPSTRQLAQITGLHRNTISKVYQKLEKVGLVESLTGSGIYVKAQGNEGIPPLKHLTAPQNSEIEQIISQNIDQLLLSGSNLEQIKELFLAEIDWRLSCNALVFVTVPSTDMGAGKLIVLELEKALMMPIQLIPLEELHKIIKQQNSATIVTSRYFVTQVLEIITLPSIRVIPVDISDYAKELQIIKQLPADSCLGIVSLSSGILRVAEMMVQSLRGNEVMTIIAQPNDYRRLQNLVSRAHTIICDNHSYSRVKKMILATQEDLIRPPKLICSDNYIGDKSIQLLKQELGLG
ncbi:GntR family transcriptional regulator [Cyanobacterium stanieri LEGE 03274]|uniref:GntR family transcriptional regulator n=1 Tax=Cyanobacterium stanieri LEGE 03274 TaxID=1828756 RepID=A0ABR9V616_9CHRO|nr:GntR family transcriptional regulator [Cyanobacterium stanieri]MBE9223312.1 GntR family transcriptional regulator [Cyanobacterium stanieri LEGE 03274]